MKIHFTPLFQSTITAVLVFILLDAAVEQTGQCFFGLSLLPLFEKRLEIEYGARFQVINFALFSTQMLLVMLFYAALRLKFTSKLKPVIICACFFLVFIGLFLGQMVNLGVYPTEAALLFSISTLISFPAALFAGASVYEKSIGTEHR